MDLEVRGSSIPLQEGSIPLETIIKSAAAGDVPEQSMLLPEELLWYQLRDLYRQFRSGGVTKADAANAKARFISEYNRNMANLFIDERIAEQHAQMWKEIEAAGTAYRKGRTLEHADAFVDAVYGIRRKIDAIKEPKAEPKAEQKAEPKATETTEPKAEDV